MPDIHVYILALQVPNLFPKRAVDRLFSRELHGQSPFDVAASRAARLIIATLLFAIGIVIAYVWTRKPKPAEPATWAQTIVGAMAVWVMFALGYGVIPHEWLTFGNSYLNFDTATFLMQQEPLHPRSTSRATSVVDDRRRRSSTASCSRCRSWLFVSVAEAPGRSRPRPRPPTPRPTPIARRTAAPPAPRREKRVSAYGRPVTTEAT